MDQQLILGILLIVVGIAVGLIAAAVIVNRRIDAREAAEAGDDSADEVEAQEAGDKMMGEIEAQEAGDGSAGEAEATEAADEPAEDTGPPADEQPEPGPADEPEPATESAGSALDKLAPEPASAPSSDSLLGELHRDPATGALVFKSGGREFRSASDIDDRSQRERLAGAAAELTAWFEQAEQAGQAAQASGKVSATGMVQAIDQILQRSLKQLDSSPRGVRLIQDISGGVKVLIGVKSYEVDEVPDEQIRRLIRQAVAEWEAQQ